MAATLRKAALFIAFLAGAFVLTRNTPFFYNLRGYSAHSGVKVSHVLSHKLRNSRFSSRPVSVWTKHGYVSLFRPFAVDLTVGLDVEINPGPNTATLQCQGERLIGVVELASGSRKSGIIRSQIFLLLFRVVRHATSTSVTRQCEINRQIYPDRSFQ